MKHRTHRGVLALATLLVITTMVGGGSSALMGAVLAESPAPVAPSLATPLPEAVFTGGATAMPSATAGAVMPYGPTPSATFETFFATTLTNTSGASLAVDAAGGVHAAMSGYTAVPGTSIYPVYSGYCASGCADAAHWQWAVIGQVGLGASDIGVVRLALDPQGRLRLMWFYLASPLANQGTWHYAECDASCSEVGSWTDYAVVDVNSLGSPGEGRYFALDHLGRPHFVYLDLNGSHKGTFHAFCDANCANGGEWREYRLNEGYQYNSSLVFTSSGLARLAYRTGDYLAYYENLDGENTWGGGFFFDLGYDASFSLRLDSQDRPRLAIYSGYQDGEPDNDQLSYAWCQDGCDVATSWSEYRLGLPDDFGMDVDLVLDAQDRPHVAFHTDYIGSPGIYGLGYARCVGGCESGSPIWRGVIVDTPEHLDQVAPMPAEEGCEPGWLYIGVRPSLAVDVSGQVHIGYDCQHYQGITCDAHNDVNLVRLASVDSSYTPPLLRGSRLYVPMIRTR